MLESIYVQQISEMQEKLEKLLLTDKLDFTEDSEKKVPECPGIYLIRDNNKISYLGSAQNLKLRLWTEHYLGERPRMGGSQFRRILNERHALKGDNKQITKYIRTNCSFATISMMKIEKRELVFLEEFMNSILRPELIKYHSTGVIWGKVDRINKPIEYICHDCGKKFESGRVRHGLKVCADCAGKRRKEQRGSIQVKRNILK